MYAIGLRGYVLYYTPVQHMFAELVTPPYGKRVGSMLYGIWVTARKPRLALAALEYRLAAHIK